MLWLTGTHAGRRREKERSRHGGHDPGAVGHVFKNSLYGTVAFRVVLSYNDGMEYQSALYLDYILSHGAYLRGFIQNENTNLMSTKFNKQRIWKESHEISLVCQLN